MPEQTKLFSIESNLTSRAEMLEVIEAATPAKPVRIATLNAQFFMLARNNTRFSAALSRMTHTVIDGSGPAILAKISSRLGFTPAISRYPGADLVHDIFEKYADGSRRIMLLGGNPGIAEAAAKNLTTRFPQLNIVSATDGGLVDSENPQPTADQLELINESRPDILLVGFGAPKQELWIDAAKGLPVMVMIGVGGSFGFYTTKKRAPQWMRGLGLEWLYRGLTEPGHWGRVFQAIILFPLAAIGWLIKRGITKS